MKEDEAQSEEAKDEGIFLRFGDDGAMDANAQAFISLPRMVTPKNCPRIERAVAVVSLLSGKNGHVKVANRPVHRSGARPGDGHPAGAVDEVAAAANPRPNVVPTGVGDIPQKHVGESAAVGGGVVGEGERGRVGGVAGDGDVVVGVGRP